MAYVDIATLMTIATGQPLPAAVVQQINDNDEWTQSPPSCAVYRSTAQNITSGAGISTLTPDTQLYDTDAMWSTGANVTCQTAGTYLISTTIRFAAQTDTTDRLVQIYHNGTSTSYNIVQVDAADEASRDTILSGSIPLVFTAGQSFCVKARTGTTTDVTIDNLSAIRISR